MANLVATTITGDLTVDTDTLYVDSSNNRVGIGETSPADKLHVDGAIRTSSRYLAGSTGVSTPDYSFASDGSMGMYRVPGSLCFSTGGTERMRIDSSGNLLVGKSSTAIEDEGISILSTGRLLGTADSDDVLVLRRNTTDGDIISFRKGGTTVGSISVTGSATAYNTSSDYRLKENVVEMTGATDRVKQLQPKRFKFIADADTIVDGFLAHEVSEIVPEAITGTKDEVEIWEEGEELPEGISVGDNKLDDEGNTIPVYQGIDHSKLVPLLTSALQEAIAKIETLEARLNALES